jgi:hypothetical protein
MAKHPAAPAAASSIAHEGVDLLASGRAYGTVHVDAVAIKRPGDNYTATVDLGWPVADDDVERLVPGASSMLAAGRKGESGSEPDDALTSGRLRVRMGRRRVVLSLHVDESDLPVLERVVDLQAVALRWDGPEARLVARVRASELPERDAVLLVGMLGRPVRVGVADVQGSLPLPSKAESALPPEA